MSRNYLNLGMGFLFSHARKVMWHVLTSSIIFGILFHFLRTCLRGWVIFILSTIDGQLGTLLLVSKVIYHSWYTSTMSGNVAGNYKCKIAIFFGCCLKQFRQSSALWCITSDVFLMVFVILLTLQIVDSPKPIPFVCFGCQRHRVFSNLYCYWPAFDVLALFPEWEQHNWAPSLWGIEHKFPFWWFSLTSRPFHLIWTAIPGGIFSIKVQIHILF